MARTAEITVSTKTGLKSTIKVTVPKAKTTKLSCKGIAVQKGKKAALKPVVTPDYSDDVLSFKSADKTIATVTSKGVVTGRKKGATYVVVTSGAKSMKVKVVVK